MSARTAPLQEARGSNSPAAWGGRPRPPASASSSPTPAATHINRQPTPTSRRSMLKRPKAQHDQQGRSEGGGGGGGGVRGEEAGVHDGGLKAQLLTLSMEIEDRCQAVDLLRAAIQSEDTKYDSLEADLEALFGPKVKDTKESLNLELSDNIHRIEQMVHEKQEMTGRLRCLVEEIRVEEGKTAQAVEEIRREGAEELQRSYGIWGEGEVARRERWVAKKAEEVRERTIKGLEPEVERIMDQHKMDCLEIERQLQEEERSLRQAIATRQEESLSSQELKLRLKGEHTVEREREVFTAKVNKLLEEHQQHLHRLRGRLMGEKETQRKWHMDELRRHQEKHAADLGRLQTSQQEQLKTVRDKFLEEKDSLNQHHLANLATQKQQVVLERGEWEVQMRHKIEEERETHTRREKARLGRIRDAEIDKTIHTLQTENVLFEKKAVASMNRRVEQMRQDHENEKETLSKEVEFLTSRYDEEIQRQHRATQDLARFRRTLKERRAELRAQEENLARLKMEVEREQHKMVEEENAIEEQRARVEEEHQQQVMEMERTIQEMQGQIERCQSELDRRRREIDVDHERVLQALHQEVKDKVLKMDAETARVREALATEQVKKKQLERMLKKYEREEGGKK